jgi:transglutaminase-like putative cysteine protease
MRLPRTSYFPIAEGPDGTRRTLELMAAKVRQAKLNPMLRMFAAALIQDCPAKAWVTEIRTIFNYVRDQIRYTLDTHDIEVLHGPAFVLRHRYGDCDDKCMLVATLLECVGHPCQFVAVGFAEQGGFSHVMVETSGAGETAPICLDTTEGEPMGWYPPGVTCRMVQSIVD